MAASKLPMEILLDEILPRLPVKSLLRFKCVCKFFRTLIPSPEFIHRRLRHSLSSDVDRLLILTEKLGGVRSFHWDSPEFPAVSLPFCGEVLFLGGSCNGLVCIGTPSSSLIIFNPSTGIYREVCYENSSLNDADAFTNYGFGFDDISDDYKVVKVTNGIYYDFYPDDYYRFGVRREVEVYSLKSDSWSLVEKTSNIDSMQQLGYGVLVDNHLLHWRNERTKLVHLGVLDGCLCLLTENSASIGGGNVWIMKEYGVKDSWVKFMRISFTDIHGGVEISPFAYARGSRSEILIRIKWDCKFFWYNCRDKTWRWAEIQWVPDYYEACICKGSLVRLLAPS
ncbi:hypothetical protein Cgig2_023687 [Carnegiea gigantea]|uniref:F-box domain-containing protein n=1 Tax=Carnegiea gigantea TaxID=171969 RepID=A0A9Q1KKR2_9CARY|nr:hypothetical protein Cgig2_023687 [Carnegiea gigantea]